MFVIGLIGFLFAPAAVTCLAIWAIVKSLECYQSMDEWEEIKRITEILTK